MQTIKSGWCILHNINVSSMWRTTCSPLAWTARVASWEPSARCTSPLSLATASLESSSTSSSRKIETYCSQTWCWLLCPSAQVDHRTRAGWRSTSTPRRRASRKGSASSLSGTAPSRSSRRASTRRRQTRGRQERRWAESPSTSWSPPTVQLITK